MKANELRMILAKKKISSLTQTRFTFDVQRGRSHGDFAFHFRSLADALPVLALNAMRSVGRRVVVVDATYDSRVM